jgi:hypothetical protein
MDKEYEQTTKRVLSHLFLGWNQVNYELMKLIF